MSIQSRKVKYVKFHDGLFVPGLGTIGDTLPSQQKNFRLNMTTDITGLCVQIGYGSVNEEVFVPWPNVKAAALYPDDRPEVPAPLKAVANG